MNLDNLIIESADANLSWHLNLDEDSSDETPSQAVSNGDTASFH